MKSRRQILRDAGDQDERRQGQIDNQKKSIDRLLLLLGAAEEFIEDRGMGDLWREHRQQVEQQYSQGSAGEEADPAQPQGD